MGYNFLKFYWTKIIYLSKIRGWFLKKPCCCDSLDKPDLCILLPQRRNTTVSLSAYHSVMVRVSRLIDTLIFWRDE